MKEKIVGSKTVVLPNAGHMAFADQTAIFVNAVDGFV
jgi:pimeloyl-ACP methyl ester carboxylesterase